ncbi:MAG: hypothetical protein WCH05_00580 [Chlorobiaceae bacterium]
MEGRGKRAALFFAALVTAAFLVNFCWESLHGLLYDDHPLMAAERYVPMMLFMASMDAVGIAVLYVLTAIGARQLYWQPFLRNMAVFSLSALVAAFAVEHAALYWLHLWHYRTAMPELFGVGILPLIQMPLTGLFSVAVARKMVPGG